MCLVFTRDMGAEMTREDIIHMAHKVGLHLATDSNWMPVINLEYAEKFAALVATAEREKARAEIDALYEMYKLVCSQRDELMDQQRAQVAAMRGRMQ